MVHISFVPTLVLMVFYASTFRRMCAVLNMAVLCSSRTSWLPGMLHTYFLNDFEMVPVAPVITGITVVFTFHIRWISIIINNNNNNNRRRLRHRRHPHPHWSSVYSYSRCCSRLFYQCCSSSYGCNISSGFHYKVRIPSLLFSHIDMLYLKKK